MSVSFFQMLYEVLIGQERGPRFGSFVALYGIDETRALIKRRWPANWPDHRLKLESPANVGLFIARRRWRKIALRLRGWRWRRGRLRFQLRRKRRQGLRVRRRSGQRGVGLVAEDTASRFFRLAPGFLIFAASSSPGPAVRGKPFSRILIAECAFGRDRTAAVVLRQAAHDRA